MEEEKKDLGKQAADALRGLFHEFREGLDDLQLPTLVDMAAESGVARLLIREGKAVGFFMVIDGYIEGIYVQPEHRRKGIARDAVLEYWREKEFTIPPIQPIRTLHVIKANKEARKFWFSIFDMHKIDENPVDTLYEIDGLKERWVKPYGKI